MKLCIVCGNEACEPTDETRCFESSWYYWTIMHLQSMRLVEYETIDLEGE